MWGVLFGVYRLMLKHMVMMATSCLILEFVVEDVSTLNILTDVSMFLFIFSVLNDSHDVCFECELYCGIVIICSYFKK